MLDSFLSSLEAFHLLRPLWVLLIPIIMFIWWRVHCRHQNKDTEPHGIEPHLAEAMTLKQQGVKRWQPIDTTALALILLVFAASGPSWSRVAHPLQSESAPMAVVLEVTPSMETTDLPPNRLDRAKFKVVDLIKQRIGARTAVIVYSGTSHRLTPLSEDPEVLEVMLNAVSTEIMPEEGNSLREALKMAQMELNSSATPGTILLVTDGVEVSDLSAFDIEEVKAPVVALVASPSIEPLGAIAQAKTVGVVRISADSADIDQIQQLANSAYQSALLGNEKLEWEDRGWMFAWLAAILIALWFRKGWAVQWSWAVCALSLSLFQPTPAEADVVDYFLTPDQQAMLAYDNQDYEIAAQTYQDPMWRAHSLMKMGEFEEAAAIYAGINTAEAAFAEGFCLQKTERFKQSVRAYERALVLRPDYIEAEHNLVLARAIARSMQSNRKRDTKGDQAGAGKGNPEEGGDIKLTSSDQMSSMSSQQFSTTEEWMRAVDTDMAEFLKIRFRMEAQEKQK